MGANRIYLLVLLLALTMVPGVCPAQASEQYRTRVALPTTQIRLTTTFNMFSAAHQEPPQSESCGAHNLAPVDALNPIRLGCALGFSNPPDSPGLLAFAFPENLISAQSGTASLSGTVVDKSGDVLVGAQATLTGPPGSPVRTVQSGIDGQFEFTGLIPGIYTLTVNAPGMSTSTSSGIPLRADQSYVLPPINLAASRLLTTLTVNGNSKHLSVEQLHTQEQQLVVGFIPNFYTSYNWNAPPMLAKQKFQLSLRDIVDPVSLLSVAGIAGGEQYENIFPGYGGGIEGYGKRYGAALANHTTGILLGRAVFPSIFHQDPRYFYKGKGTIESRALYAIAAAVIARGDNGKWEPNYSALLAHFSAGAISNLYYPPSNRGASLVLLNGFAGIGTDAVSNLIREFLLKPLTSHVPIGANRQP